MHIVKNITVAITLLLATTFAHAEIWKITSLEWPPYAGENLPGQGTSIVKLRELLEANGIDLVVEFYPWTRAQKLASSEGYVGYFPAWPEEVADGFFATGAVDWSSISVIKKSESDITFTNLDALFKQHTIGIVKSYVYPDDIASAAEKYPRNVSDSKSEEVLLNKLAIGRNDAVITDPNVIRHLAELAGIEGLKELTQLTRKELVIAFKNDVKNSPIIQSIVGALDNAKNQLSQTED